MRVSCPNAILTWRSVAVTGHTFRSRLGRACKNVGCDDAAHLEEIDMKLTLPQVPTRTVLVIVCALVAACWKPGTKQERTETPEEPAATPAPVSTPLPATPAPAPVVQAATPEPNHFAPPGVFFVVRQASIETQSGIIGLRPGTRLQQTGPGEYTDREGHKLTLPANQVTNDLRIANQVVGADAAAQDAIRQMYGPRRSTSQGPTLSTPSPRPIDGGAAVKKPTTLLGETSTLGPAQTRVQGGYYWERDANGNWRRGRPVK